MSDWIKTDRQNIWHPFTPLTNETDPVLITSGSGVYLHTHDGNSIIDAVSSWWVNLHGHANPYIADAMAKQAMELDHVIFAGFTHKPAIQLSQNLLSILPENQDRIFFSDDGSTAVEVGIKMALQYWFNSGKPKGNVIAIAGAYHGDTFGAMSIGERGIFTAPFVNHLFNVKFIDFPDERNEANSLNQFKELVRAGDVAAFVFEPLIQGAAGMRMYRPEVLNELMTLAHESEVLCIADEVFTGFGRTGKLFASHYLSEKPDIIAVSKGITGGILPLGVTSCSTRISEMFQSGEFTKTFFHGHSYTANPIACAAANASFDLLMRAECQQQVWAISEAHRDYISSVRNHPQVKDARSLGTIMAIELDGSGESNYQNDLRKKIYPFFMDRGILLRPLGNVIYLVPPYVITPEQLKIVYDAISEFLQIEL